MLFYLISSAVLVWARYSIIRLVEDAKEKDMKRLYRDIWDDDRE